MEDNPCDSSPGLSTESSSCSWVCYEQDNHTSNNAYCPDWNPRKCDGVITVKSRRRKLIDKLEFFFTVQMRHKVPKTADTAGGMTGHGSVGLVQ